MRTNTFFKLFSIGGVIALLLALGVAVVLAQTSTVFDEPAVSQEAAPATTQHDATQTAGPATLTASERIDVLFSPDR